MIRLGLLTLTLVAGVHGRYVEGYGSDVSLPIPLSNARKYPDGAVSQASQLWHENAQIQWREERLFRPDQSLSFQYIKAGGVDLHFLDHTHLEGFDAQVCASAVLCPSCLAYFPFCPES